MTDRHDNAESASASWRLSWRTDPIARAIADRHYNRQSIGAQDFMPPGRCLVLLGSDEQSLWGTSWPLAEYVKHDWAGAWVNSVFRREGGPLASDLIREAVVPGWCYRQAGFVHVGFTKGGLWVYQMTPDRMPPAAAPAPRLGALMAV